MPPLTHLPRSFRPLLIASTALAATAITVVGVTATGPEDPGTIRLTVDGEPREAALVGDTVADVLAGAGLAAGPHDLLSPAPETVLDDGDSIALRRATELRLVVDGVPRSVWVTADDVGGALDQAGVEDDGAFVSASRSRSVEDGLTVELRTPKAIRLNLDGQRYPRNTSARTVRDALVEAGVKLTAADTVAPARTTPLREGQVVTITRQVSVAEPVGFATERRADATLLEGRSRTVRDGVPGLRRTTYDVVHGDVLGGPGTRVEVDRTPVRPAVTRVVAYGTKPVPEPAPAPAPAPTRSAPAASSSAGGPDWAALAKCESGGDPGAISPSGTYHGLYQFSVATWRSVGGSGLPSEASPGEQTSRAATLLERSGAGQWPVCGRNL